MAKQIGIGIIGCGQISERHGLGYMAIPEKARVVATSDVVVQLAKEKAKRWGAEAFYSDYKELLQRADIDAVDVLVPHDLHAEVTILAAKAGKHVLCEKPMATTLEDADEMINIAKQENIKLMVGHNWRFKLNYVKMKEIIDGGTIGEVYLTTIEWGGWIVHPANHWRLSLSKAGGGVLIGQGTHYFDLWRWLIGEVEAVYGISENLIHKDREIEDNMVTLVRFKNGALGTMLCTQTEKNPCNNERMKMYGTKGTAIAVRVPSLLEIYSDEAPEHLRGWTSFHLGDQQQTSIDREVEHFVDCIREDKAPLVTGEDGKVALKIVLAAYRSLKSHEWVKIL